MTLEELVAAHGRRPAQSVPEWMLGFWKRYAISFADGRTDLHTHVCWLQSRNFTIDLRLPQAADQVGPRPLADYSAQELQMLASYEGWTAGADWDGQALQWRPTEISLQLHNRWPEPALLRRTGNCMIEHCPSNAYVEDWRLQPSRPGLLVGLWLDEERELASRQLRHRGGALIVCGDHAALVLGRASQIEPGPATLAERVSVAGADIARLQPLLGFETSVARLGAAGYQIDLSTRPERVGRRLCPLDGFEALPDGRVRQSLCNDEGIEIERVFRVDTLEARLDYSLATGFSPEAGAWYAREAATLGRYTDILY